MNISLTKQELVIWVERGEKLQQLAFTYEQEFEQHGLSRLHLLNVSKHNQGDIG